MPRHRRTPSAYRAAIVTILALSLVLLASSSLSGRTTTGRGVPAQTVEQAAPTPASSIEPTKPAPSAAAPEDLDALLPPCPPFSFSSTDEHPAPMDAPVAECDVRELDLGPGPVKKQAHPVPSGVELTEETP